MVGDWLAAWLAIFVGLELREWQRTGWSSGFRRVFQSMTSKAG
jgi:hypothetical protein